MKREDVLAAAEGDGLRHKLVDVPGWPEQVMVREFGALDAVLWRKTLPAPPADLPKDPAAAVAALQAALPAGEEIRSSAKMIVLCTYHADGSAKFFEYEDWPRVANFKREVFNVLAVACAEVNGTSKAALEEAAADFEQARS